MARRTSALFCPRCQNLDLPKRGTQVTSVIVRLCPRCTENKYPEALAAIQKRLEGIKGADVIYG